MRQNPQDTGYTSIYAQMMEVIVLSTPMVVENSQHYQNCLHEQPDKDKWLTGNCL